MVLTDTGLAKVFQRIKSFIASQLNSKASVIHTHTSSEITDLSNGCVNLSTAQTIGGVKTFSDGLFASKSGQGDLATLEDSSINSTNEGANGMPLNGHTNSVKIKGSQFNVVPCMLTGQLYTSGDTSAELRAYKYKDLTTNAIIALRYVYADNRGFVQFKNISSVIPSVTSTANLGSASLQWNTTYTRNILIDNDINIASSLINKTSTSGVISIRGGLNTQDGASIGLYGKDYNGAIAGNIYMTAYGNSDYTTFRIYPNGAMSVYNNSRDTTKNVAMQEDTVNLTTAQTIGGEKTFSNLRTYFGRDISLYSVRKYGKNLNPTSNTYQYLNFSGNLASEGSTNDWSGGYIEQVINTDGSSRGRWFIQDTSENSVGLELWASGNDKQVRPLRGGDTDLGTTNRKWKSLNGINPGALSLPSMNFISLDTTNFDVTATTIGTFTPTVDGWAILSMTQKNKHFGIWILNAGYRATFHSVKNNDDYFIFALMPVRANVTMNVYCTADDIDSTRKIDWIRLFPCKGNV